MNASLDPRHQEHASSAESGRASAAGSGPWLRRLSILMCAIGSLLAAADAASAQTQSRNPQNGGASLRERLVFGLKARHPSEFTYLEQLSDRVDQGLVPQKLVDETYFWVRKNKPRSNFPFIYFERILRLRGEKADVPLPVYRGPYRID